MEELSGKTAVVTGAASGIGRALAERLGGEGMRLVLADVESGPLDKAAAALREAGNEVLAVPTDVSDAAQMDALGEQALGAFGAVHVVCNNAGVGWGGPTWELGSEDWQFVLGPNLWGVIHGIRVFGRHLVAQNEGHIVNTASLAGLICAAGLGAYNASKHAVVAISETLHLELRAAGSQVGVSVLCPGFVNTRIHDSGRHRSDGRAALGGATPEETEGRRRLVEAFFAQAMPPARVAEQVVEAIRTRRFYVITHPQGLGAVERRMRAILNGEDPPALGQQVFTGGSS